MGVKLGSATAINCLLVSSGLSALNFTLVGNNEFWSCHTDFMPKHRHKKCTFEFSWISQLAGMSKCMACMYTNVPGSVLPIYKS